MRWRCSPAARAALADPGESARLLVDHPSYKAERELTEANRRDLLQDLA